MAKNKEKQYKKEVGQRILRFRNFILKKQHELAGQIDVNQSTITNIEVGKTFPRLPYLRHWQEEYKLDCNWVVSGIDNMFLIKNNNRVQYLTLNSSQADKIEEYEELIDLMRVPVIEKLILAKLQEIKIIAKDEILSFFKDEKGLL